MQFSQHSPRSDNTARPAGVAQTLLLACVVLLSLATFNANAEDGSSATDMAEAHDYPSATKCGECHPTQYAQWSVSQHAYAQMSPIFNAMQAQSLKPHREPTVTLAFDATMQSA
jgi:cytochrome c553